MKGRPEVVGFRVSTEERAAIRAVAERLNRTEGGFIRLAALRVAQELEQSFAPQTTDPRADRLEKQAA
jgi:uncharacterized protein (DUF1778 family)